MTPETKRYILGTLRNVQGDDLERAQMAFSHYTPEQMQKEWGQSGKTCQEILDSYLVERKRLEAIIKEMENS